MKIELGLYSSLSVYMPETNRAPLVVDVNEGISIWELLGQFKVPPDLVKIIFLNGVHAQGDEVLKQGDRIGVFPLIAGG